MNNVTIIAATVADLDILQAIGRKTFYETFSHFNTKENIAQYMEQGFSKEKLLLELQSNLSEIYFAQLNEETIGYLKINLAEAQTELKDSNAVEIERIYVLAEFHGKKIGQLLLEKAIQLAQSHNAPYVWLGVWEENNKAIGFYKRNGFVEFDKHIFTMGTEDQTDLMMKKDLK